MADSITTDADLMASVTRGVPRTAMPHHNFLEEEDRRSGDCRRHRRVRGNRRRRNTTVIIVASTRCRDEGAWRVLEAHFSSIDHPLTTVETARAATSIDHSWMK